MANPRDPKLTENGPPERPEYERYPQGDPQRTLFEQEPDVWRERPDYVHQNEAWRRWYRDRLRCRARGEDGYRCHWGIREPHRDLCTACRERGAQAETWGSGEAHETHRRPESPESPARPVRRGTSLGDEPGTAIEAPRTLGGTPRTVPTLTPAQLAEARSLADPRSLPAPAPGAEPPQRIDPPRSGETGAAPASRGTPQDLRGATPLDLDALEAQLDLAAIGLAEPPRGAVDLRGGVPGQSFELDGVRIETTLHGPGVSFTRTLREAPERKPVTVHREPGITTIVLDPGATSPAVPDATYGVHGLVPSAHAITHGKPRRRASSLDDLGPRQLHDDEKLPPTCQLSNKGCPRYYARPRRPGDDLPERQEPPGGPTCCPEGLCWYDAQLARRAERKPAVTPAAWLAILRGEIEG